jgi:hypothetical protein
MKLSIDTLNTHLTVRFVQVPRSQTCVYLRDISNLCLILFDNTASQFQFHLLPGSNLKQTAVANHLALNFTHLLLGNGRLGNARDGLSVFK